MQTDVNVSGQAVLVVALSHVGSCKCDALYLCLKKLDKDRVLQLEAARVKDTHKSVYDYSYSIIEVVDPGQGTLQDTIFNSSSKVLYSDCKVTCTSITNFHI